MRCARSARRSERHGGDTDRARTPDRPSAALASTLGNAGVRRVLRAGGGHHPGRAHSPLDQSVAAAIQQRRGGGRPLDGRARAQMEDAFGADFTAVRIHTDAGAAQLNETVGAAAFTVGKDIFFQHGGGNPASTAGTALLAHELAHVVQQSGMSARAPTMVTTPLDPSEREATRVADQVVRRIVGVPRTPPAAAALSPARPPAVARCGAVDPAACPCHTEAGPTVARSEDHDLPSTAPTCERPTSVEDGPGEARRRLTSPLLRSLSATVLGMHVWELSNFDVDASFVKTEHEAYLRDHVVGPLKEAMEDRNAFAVVVGEASTTGGYRHNQRLSRRRATCVSAVLRRGLRAAGMTDPPRMLPPIGFGKVLARVRRFPEDHTEDERDRRVTVAAVAGAAGTCPAPARTRASSLFRISVACASPAATTIHIGDISDPDQPTYRRFRWLVMPGQEDCTFRAAESEQAMYGLRSDFRLATGDPDSAGAHSDFQGEATLDRRGHLLGANGFFSLLLDGRWEPDACDDATGVLRGVLHPVGPVRCGQVPRATSGDCEREEVDCSEADKMAPATEFTAMMVRGGSDISDLPIINRIPWDLLPISPEIGGVGLTIGTRNTTGPALARRFVFAGGGLGGAGADLQFGIASRAVSDTPLRFQKPDGSPGDFAGSRAKLVITGSSNTEELHAGGMVFSFSGFFCNSGPTRTLYGKLVAGSVRCSDLSPWTRFEPRRDCEVECPPDRQLAGHHSVAVTVGRASVADLPVIGTRVADRHGCEVVAAYVTIAATTDEPDEGIFREFLFVGGLAGCSFAVGRKTWTERFLLPRQLSTGDPENRFDPSDFHGPAALDDAGTLTVVPVALALPWAFDLPGRYDPSCADAKGAHGLLVPLGDVQCGAAPEPPHHTDADATVLARCRAYAKGNPRVAAEVDKLRTGGHDRYLALIEPPLPGLVYPEVALLPSRLRQVIPEARLVGRRAGASDFVTFVDIVAVDAGNDDPTRGGRWVNVAFVSEPCSFDDTGNAILIRPRDCRETLPRPGAVYRLHSVPVPRPQGHILNTP